MPSERQTDLYCALIRRAGSRARFLIGTKRGLLLIRFSPDAIRNLVARADRYLRLRDWLVKRLAAAQSAS